MAGRVLVSNAPYTLNTYKLHDYADINDMVLGAISLKSYPESPKQLFDIDHIRLVLKPLYFVTLSIHQAFTTSAGLIHEIDVSNEAYLFDGQTAESTNLDPDFYRPPDRNVQISPEYEWAVVPFENNMKVLPSKIKADMIARYTIRKSYRGGNNRVYTKKCVLAPRSIHIHDIIKIHVPAYTVKMRIMDHAYECIVTHNSSTVQMLSADWWTCDYCNSTKNLLLCNDCGHVGHASGLSPHGFTCKACRKTICKICVRTKKRMLFLTDRFCSDCE